VVKRQSIARHKAQVHGLQRQRGGEVAWLWLAGVSSGTRMGNRGVGGKRWAGLLRLYATAGLQHSARTRVAVCTASQGHRALDKFRPWRQARRRGPGGSSSHHGEDCKSRRYCDRGVNAGCCCGQYQQCAIGRPATARRDHTHLTCRQAAPVV
jgi:hypothetical protein